MIGIKFLLTFITSAFYIALGLFLALAFLFVISYAIRLFVESFRWGLSDHWKWFRGWFPGKKKLREPSGWYDVLDPKDNVTVICQTRRPEFFISRGYVVKELEDE